MDPARLPARLTTEQVYVFGKIIQDGALIDQEGRQFLVVPVSPMTADFLKGAWLPEFENNIRTNGLNDDHVGRTIATALPAPASGITLKELEERYMAEHGPVLSPENVDTHRRIFRYLYEVLEPDKKIKTITRDDINRVKEFISSIPVWYPHRFRGLTLTEAIEVAREQDLELLSTSSVDHNLARITAIFSWAERQWLIDRHPARRLKAPRDRAKPAFKRKPFTVEQLNTIFHAPLYTGCVSDWIHFTKPGPNRPKRERFWVPLLALFTGLRANEICQMDVVDVKEIDGILVFHITNQSETGLDDKRLKTPSAERYVPVHSELMRIGFGDYLQQARTSGQLKLFPFFRRDRRSTYSKTISVWFSQRYLKSLDIYDPKTTFHSFRHNFRDALRRSEASLYVMRELCGWSLPSPGLEFGYGSLLTVKDLADAIEKVEYPGLNLSHLYEDSSYA